MKFESLALCEPLLNSLQEAGYEETTPIQEKAIPKLLAGRDVLACAQTGTGKTAAFALPTLQRLMESPGPQTGAARRRQRSGRRAIRALVLSPTRELAAQIGESLKTYGKYTTVRHTVIYGGVPQGSQVRALQAGIDILVATPGRLLDLIQQGFVDLAAVEVLVLDEADHMLDMGFIHDLRKIVAHVPKERQTLMFSATMPQPIRELAQQWLRRPLEVHATPVASTPQRVSQTVCFVERQHKPATLMHFLKETCSSRTLVFSRTKHGADKIVRSLQRDGIRAISIHGNKSQVKRQAAMREFNSPSPPVLVATDLAARGLDFRDISHVINYDLPDTPETYVHRIGRTARAGASGQAISFCCHDERQRLRLIERLTGEPVPVQSLPHALQALSDATSPSEPATSATDRPRRRGSQHSHPKAARPKTARAKTAGPKTAGPKTAGPKTAGPKTAGPKTAGPKTAGPKTASSASRADQQPKKTARRYRRRAARA